MVQSVKWEEGRLTLLDQRLLPERVVYVHCMDFREITKAIADMVVRGAPAIGIAGAYGVAAAAREALQVGPSFGETLSFLQKAGLCLVSARPTAVNLKWAVDRVLSKAYEALGHEDSSGDCGPDVLEAVASVTEAEARAVEEEDVAMNRAMGDYGAALIPEKSRILTHCNAGALATGGYGTALGVIRSAWNQGKVSMVYADETRPYLQGARLTAWELLQDGIPVTVLVDSAAGHLISTGGVDCIIVGADRIARNGDVANKIGTYTLACLANIHRIPFYVAAPSSTFDLETADGSEIHVEMRSESEVLSFRGAGVAAQGAKAFNPAFDVTPARLISAIITERGVIFSPVGENLPKIVLGDDLGA